MSKRKRLAIVTGLVLVFVSCVVLANRLTQQDPTPPTITAPKTATVMITEDGFSPATLKITLGTEVVWLNTDGSPHRIAANPVSTHSSLKSLDSKTNIDTNDKYLYTFTQAGTFKYHDELHPTTNGTIIVQ